MSYMRRRITDKERMDWLSRKTTIENFYQNVNTDFESCVTQLFSFSQNGWYSTLRQAIDAAIRAERRPPSKRRKAKPTSFGGVPLSGPTSASKALGVLSKRRKR